MGGGLAGPSARPAAQRGLPALGASSTNGAAEGLVPRLLYLLSVKQPFYILVFGLVTKWL